MIRSLSFSNLFVGIMLIDQCMYPAFTWNDTTQAYSAVGWPRETRARHHAVNDDH